MSATIWLSRRIQRLTLNIWIKGCGVHIAMAFTTAPLSTSVIRISTTELRAQWRLSPSNTLVMLCPYKIEYIKQLRLVLLSRTFWGFQRQYWLDHIERRLIQKENSPVFEMFLRTVRQHQVGKEPFQKFQRVKLRLGDARLAL